jgi:hypothetical protein
MHGMKPAAVEAVGDRAPADSVAGELLTGDDAVLALGERCDQAVE